MLVIKRGLLLASASALLAGTAALGVADDVVSVPMALTDTAMLEEAGLAADSMNAYITADGHVFRQSTADSVVTQSSGVFGLIDSNWTTVGAGELRPESQGQLFTYSSTNVGSFGDVTDGAELSCPGGENEEEFHAGIDLPAGALLTNFTYSAFDNSASNTGAALLEVCQDTVTSEPTVSTLTSVISSGTPGVVLLDSSPSNTINPLFCHYVVAVDLGASGCQGADLKAYKVRVGWKRQISPAPATATFNDVPKGAQFFQSIEALAASGITGGCGGGNYCPQNFVTRGQMAAFLSRALGLHWGGVF